MNNIPQYFAYLINEADDNEEIKDPQLKKNVEKVLNDNSKPSYDDVLELVKLSPSDNKDDIITKDEYEKLSDEEKESIHDALKLALTTKDDNDEPISDVVNDVIKNIEKYQNKKDKKAQKDEYDKATKVFVHYVECIYNPSNKPQPTMDNPTADKDELADIDKSFVGNKIDYKKIYNLVVDKEIAKELAGTYDVNKDDTKVFATMDQAKEYVAKRIDALKKFGVKREDFVKCDPPEALAKYAPDAVGYRYTKLETLGDTVKHDDVSHEKIIKDSYFTYWIYTGASKVPEVDFVSEIASAWEWMYDPDGYRKMQEKKKETEEKQKEIMNGLASYEKKLRDEKKIKKQKKTENPFDDGDDEYEIGGEEKGDEEIEISKDNTEVKDKRKNKPSFDDDDDGEEDYDEEDERNTRDKEDYERFGSSDDDDEYRYGADDDWNSDGTMSGSHKYSWER